MKRKNHGSRWIVAGAAVAGFAALHLVPRLAVSMPSTVPSAAQANGLLDTDPIENTFAQLNEVPTPDKDTFTIRGRVSVDAGATPVADGVANGVVVTILQSALQNAACGGFTPVDSKAFTASQCQAVERGRSLYCKDTTDGSFFRLRRSSSPTNFRINTIVRGRNFDPGHPYGIPLAGDVLMTQAHWFGQTEVERCRVTHNGERTACRSKGVSPLPPPCPTPTPVGPTPTPTPPPGPTPTSTPGLPTCEISFIPSTIGQGQTATISFTSTPSTFDCVFAFGSNSIPTTCGDSGGTVDWLPNYAGQSVPFLIYDSTGTTVLCSTSLTFLPQS